MCPDTMWDKLPVPSIPGDGKIPSCSLGRISPLCGGSPTCSVGTRVSHWGGGVQPGCEAPPLVGEWSHLSAAMTEGTPLSPVLLHRSWEQKWCLPQVQGVTGRPQGCGTFSVGRAEPERGTLLPPPPRRAQGERPLLSTQSRPSKDSCLCGHTEALSDLESTEMIVPLIL